MKHSSSLPFELHPDPFDKAQGVKSGRVVHTLSPHFEARFVFCAELPEEQSGGFSIFNVDRGVYLSELKLLDGKDIKTSFKEVNQAMREAVRVIDDGLRLKL